MINYILYLILVILIDFITIVAHKIFLQFLRHTILVEPIEKENWLLVEKHVKSNERTEHIFDAIMVCSGHYSVPKMPNLTGSENFNGRAIHSHYYRKSDPYKGKRVLIIGAGPSGVDISNIVSEVAEKVNILVY